MADYTGFSGDPAEQSGNYIALHCGASLSDAVITAELVGGDSGEKTLDADGLMICRITDKAAETIKITATLRSQTVEYEFDLSGLTLEEAPAEVG